MLPILHLNGFKIANPTVLARIGDDELRALFVGYGYEPRILEGDDPVKMHQAMAATLEDMLAEIRAIQERARRQETVERPRWPLLILRTPKGWTGPKEVDGKPVEGTWRAHQVPISDVTENPDHLEILENWLKSYKPETLFDKDGHFRPDLAALAPTGDRRMGMNPHANGGKLLMPLVLPDFRAYAVKTGEDAEATRVLGDYLRDVVKNNLKARNFRLFGPDETASNRLQAVYEASGKEWMARMEAGRRKSDNRWPRARSTQRTYVPGMARRLSVDR